MRPLVEGKSGRERVVVAMSGGVDSCVAALLLARQGYEVVGVTMRLWSAPNEQTARLNRACCSIEDVDDARATCRRIGARHHFMNFEKQFEQHVIDYFVSEYERGRTPQPCLACNDRLKFDFLFSRAELLGVNHVATGHYARIRSDGGQYRLLRGIDPGKDQSYVLHNLGPDQLSRLLLPVGEHTKSHIRSIAHQAGLGVAGKPDSQDICFIPAGDYRTFVSQRVSRRIKGELIDREGRVLGRHDGIHSFTIGQRKGLPLPGGSPRPLFVTAIDASTGTVTVGPAEDLMHRSLYASSVRWVSGCPPTKPIRVEARIRYRGHDEAALVTPVGDTAHVEFDRPQRAITPGQAVVFYSGEEVLGGGSIELAPPSPVQLAADSVARSLEIIGG